MPPPLPAELTALIIRYVSELPRNTNTLSSIALTSHQFRYFANTHRFAHVNFQRRELLASYVHAFVDLLLSTVWVPEASIVSHVRHIALSLGARGKGMLLGPHPVLADGTYTTILKTLLVAGEGSSAQGYSLKLTTNICERSALLGPTSSGYERFDWSTLPRDFVGAVRDTCRKSRLITFHLDWLDNVPTNIFSGLPPTQLLLDQVEFATNSSDHEQDHESVLDGNPTTVPDLRILHIMKSNFMELTKTQANIFQNLRTLSYDIRTPGDLNSIFHMKKHLGRLESVTLRTCVTNFVAIAAGFMDFDAMPNLQYMFIALEIPHMTISDRIASVSIPRHTSEPYKPCIHPINITVLLLDGRTYTAYTADTYLAGFISQIEPTIMKSFIRAMAPSLPASLSVTVHMTAILDVDADGHQFDREAYRKANAMSIRDYFSGAGCMEDIEFKVVVSIHGDAVAV